jgi:Tfp pilus assembly protein PilE
MSDNTAVTARVSILTAIIAAVNIAFTAYVNYTFQARLETTKTELQQTVQDSEQRTEQLKAVTGIENSAYLNGIPKLQSEIEEDLAFAESVTEGTVPERSRDQTAERHRLKARLLTAACQPRPNDAKLIAAADLLNKNVDLLRQSIIADTISEEYGTRMANLIDALKTFQAEVYRVAEAGYGATDSTGASIRPRQRARL